MTPGPVIALALLFAGVAIQLALSLAPRDEHSGVSGTEDGSVG